MEHPTNQIIWYAEQRDLAIEERDVAIARAETADAEVAALKAAARWMSVSEPPQDDAGEYLGWDGYRTRVVDYFPEREGHDTDWPWFDSFGNEIPIILWRPMVEPPQEAPAA